MKNDHLTIVANTALACAVAIVLLSPKFAYSVQVEPAASKLMGNPVENRKSLPSESPPQQRPAVQPVKDQLALQKEIDSLKAIANKATTGTPAKINPAALQQRRQAATAAWVLGLLSANGLGVELDYSEALQRFRQAQQLGEASAIAGLAWCEIQGCEGLPSAQNARTWISQLRAVKPSRALYFDWLLDETFSPLQHNSAANAALLDKTRQQRRQLLLNAAKLMDVQALIELGFDALAAEKIKEAQNYFAAAAPFSVVAAQNVSLLQMRQSDNPVNCKIQNSADLSDGALLSTAQALHRGQAGTKGCPVNYAEAIRLYNLAASKGNLSAKRMLSLIYSKPGVNGSLNIGWMQQLASFDAANLSLNSDSAGLAHMLKREPTPLFDLIPQNLRNLANTPKP
ncbi:MAG: hypothetical protein RL535_1491 [Pseudomonadota bacterium]